MVRHSSPRRRRRSERSRPLTGAARVRLRAGHPISRQEGNRPATWRSSLSMNATAGSGSHGEFRAVAGRPRSMCSLTASTMPRRCSRASGCTAGRYSSFAGHTERLFRSAEILDFGNPLHPPKRSDAASIETCAMNGLSDCYVSRSLARIGDDRSRRPGEHDPRGDRRLGMAEHFNPREGRGIALTWAK